MDEQQAFYLCPTCFETSETFDRRHPHNMIRVEPAGLDDEQRRPILDDEGRVMTRAPRWFLEAVSVKAGRPSGNAIR